MIVIRGEEEEFRKNVGERRAEMKKWIKKAREEINQKRKREGERNGKGILREKGGKSRKRERERKRKG